MIDTSDVPPCTACGACCFSTAPDYLLVADGDYERLGEDAARLTQLVGARRYMRSTEGHCVALAIDATERSFRCSVYERRPDVCRWLERGSGQCRADRREKAERPLLALERRTRPRG